jgi:hypothetical protein
MEGLILGGAWRRQVNSQPLIKLGDRQKTRGPLPWNILIMTIRAGGGF